MGREGAQDEGGQCEKVKEMGADEREWVWLGWAPHFVWPGTSLAGTSFHCPCQAGKGGGEERVEGGKGGGAWVICCSFGVHDALTCFQLLLQSTALPAKKDAAYTLQGILKGVCQTGCIEGFKVLKVA